MAGRSKEKEERNLEFLPADSPELLNPILDGINASKKTRELSHSLAETVEETTWVVGMRRTTVAATAVYVAARATGERITQSGVADCSDTSVGSISKRKQDLLEEYLEICENAADERMQELDQADL